MKCHECGYLNHDSVPVCDSCDTKLNTRQPDSMPKRGANRKLAIGVVLGIFVLAGARGLLRDADRSQPSGSPAPTPSAPALITAPAVRPADAAPSEGSKWSYADLVDQMTGRQSHIATIESSNTISLDFPYQGEQHGTIQIIKHPRVGNRVALDIEKGQFLPVSLGGHLTARFDAGAPRRLWYPRGC